MQPYITAKYREFLERAKQWRADNKQKYDMKEAADEAKVAPLKIRISARKKKRADGEEDGLFVFSSNIKAQRAARMVGRRHF